MGIFGAVRLTPAAHRDGLRTSGCGSCSPTCSRTSDSITPPKAEVMQKYLTLSDPRVRAAIHRRARRRHFDLAGIGVFRFFLTRRSRRDGTNIRPVAEGHHPDHRLGARARSAAPARKSHAPTIRSTPSTMMVVCCRSTTSCIWYHSANICPTRTGWKSSASSNSPKFRADLFQARRRRTLEFPNAPRASPL